MAADIYSEVNNGSTVSNTAFAALSSASGSSFYQVDLLTGKASRTGDFSARNQVVGIAFPQNQR